MPEYEVTVKFDECDSLTPRGAAEGVYLHLITDMLYHSLKLDVRDKKTGKVEVIELEADLENDESMLRHYALIGLAMKFMTEDQKRELEAWEKEHLDGQGVGTSDWPGWEPIIGKKPKEFRVIESVRD